MSGSIPAFVIVVIGILTDRVSFPGWKTSKVIGTSSSPRRSGRNETKKPVALSVKWRKRRQNVGTPDLRHVVIARRKDSQACAEVASEPPEHDSLRGKE